MNNEPFCSAYGTAVEGFVQPVVQPKTTNNVYSADQKSRIAADLLGIFLGCYGVHNFYFGYTAKAVIQLVSTIIGYVLSCIFIGYFIIAGIGIWVLIESIMIFAGSINVDAKGVPLKD